MGQRQRAARRSPRSLLPSRRRHLRCLPVEAVMGHLMFVQLVVGWVEEAIEGQRWDPLPLLALVAWAADSWELDSLH